MVRCSLTIQVCIGKSTVPVHRILLLYTSFTPVDMQNILDDPSTWRVHNHDQVAVSAPFFLLQTLMSDNVPEELNPSLQKMWRDFLNDPDPIIAAMPRRHEKHTPKNLSI